MEHHNNYKAQADMKIIWDIDPDDIEALISAAGNVYRQSLADECRPPTIWGNVIKPNECIDKTNLAARNVVEKSRCNAAVTIRGLAALHGLTPWEAVWKSISYWHWEYMKFEDKDDDEDTERFLGWSYTLGNVAILELSAGQKHYRPLSYESVVAVGAATLLLGAVNICRLHDQCTSRSRKMDFAFALGHIPKLEDSAAPLSCFLRMGWHTAQIQNGPDGLAAPGTEWVGGAERLAIINGRLFYRKRTADGHRWEKTPENHPGWKGPGSAWRKYLTNKLRPTFETGEAKRRKILVQFPALIDQSLVERMEALEDVYAEMGQEQELDLDSDADFNMLFIDLVTDEDERKRLDKEREIFMKLARGTGEPYDFYTLNPNVIGSEDKVLDLGWMNDKPFRATPLTDLKGNVAFPFMNLLLEAMEDPEDEVDQFSRVHMRVLELYDDRYKRELENFSSIGLPASGSERSRT